MFKDLTFKKIILLLTLVPLFSWVITHTMAFFGIFLSLAYPVWRTILPTKTPCLFCLFNSEGSECPSCKRTIDFNKSITPNSVRSVFANSILILLLSFISLGLVYTETQTLKLMGFPPAQKSAEFVIPQKGTHRIGEIFPMKIELQGLKTSINAVQADVGFDPDKLEILDIKTDESFANIFVQKELNNDIGFARLTGGLPNPGYFSDRGTFGTLIFQAIGSGVVDIEFLPSSMILANDGRGSNVLGDFAKASYLILPERISLEQQQKLEEEFLTPENVLGETSDDTQLKFYDEGENVLGSQTSKKLTIKDASPSLSNRILTKLSKFNKFVLKPWKAIVNLF